MFNKMNTFNDFNDGVYAVLDKGIGNRDNVFARGGSAGGLLMGAIINLEPELYKGILSGVPFVDVLTTMSDPTIPSIGQCNYGHHQSQLPRADCFPGNQ